MNKSTKSVTLVELLLSMMAVSMIVLSFFAFVAYGQRLVKSGDKRANVQNALVLCLEHMSKYVQQANGGGRQVNGDIIYPAIELITGVLRVRVDFNEIKTPSNFSDDAVISYSLSGNELSVACSGTGCPSGFNETLSKQITVFDVGVQDNLVDISLTGRYDPAKDVHVSTNPQVEMRTKLICNSISTH